MQVKESMETLVKRKARELCSSMQLRGWASTQFIPTKPFGLTMISTTGCRAWFGKRWGMICDDSDTHLKVVLDLPKGKIDHNYAAERLGLPKVEEQPDQSGVSMIDNRDRDTVVLYLYGRELENVEFKHSEILDFISDVRRWSCL